MFRVLGFILNELLKISKLYEMNGFLLELIKNYGELIEKVVELTHDRSNWLHYPYFDYTLIPGMIREDVIENQIKEEERNIQPY
ncbi:hypothetical protein DRO97_01610 [Archaeoglobales archaeon]|nr:MAG: hypothetical protein DRO97_01610 [Archaeoglobales archaeon]